MLKIRWRILRQETRFPPDLYWMIDMIAGNKMSQNWGLKMRNLSNQPTQQQQKDVYKNGFSS